MGDKIIVMSLGGSLILDKDCNANINYLKKFKKILTKHSNYKFIVVCGGGSIARRYISGMEKINADTKTKSLAGISATRMNARFMSYFLGLNIERYGIPHKKRHIKKYLKSNRIVFCGALEYNPSQTSDGTAAELASIFNSEFINITNVEGLYNKDPHKNKDAKLISEISWKNFDKIASSIKFSPGQHFVLDQNASKIIMKNKTKTYILGKNIKELDNLLSKRKFKGTTIEG